MSDLVERLQKQAEELRGQQQSLTSQMQAEVQAVIDDFNGRMSLIASHLRTVQGVLNELRQVEEIVEPVPKEKEKTDE